MATKILFHEGTDGCALVVRGFGDDELHRSLHRNKRKASERLSRLRGALRELAPSAKVSERLRGEDAEVDQVVDKHQGRFGLLGAMEILSAAPETDLTRKAMDALAKLWEEDMGEPMQRYAVDQTEDGE